LRSPGKLDLSFVKLIFKKNECNQILQVNEFVKRARAAKIHAYIMGHLKKEMPTMMGKAKAQQRLIDNLEDEFAKVSADNLIAWLLLSGR
jgi:EH domain-containing protein 1